ncbi:hypothetical protein [Chamaesiphon sp.]|uniref:hypothetical protein n=1 Tax=Chamaesiphon sp. TaxID=2814140 RepID=UPI003593F751
MNHSDKQIVHILPGFKSFVIDSREIPDSNILLKLLRPNIDPETAMLVESWTLDSEQEMISQLILREHSNLIVSRLPEISLLDTDGVALSIGEKLEQLVKGFIPERVSFNFDVFRFHIARLEYLDYFFLPPPNYDKIGKISQQINRAYYQWKKTEKCETKAIDKYFDDSKERRNIIRKNSPDYEISEYWWNSFLYMAQKYYEVEFLELVAKKSKGFSEIVDISQKNYRKPLEKRLVKYNRPWQCPYCKKWYKQEPGGNGKPRAKCKSCFKSWDSDRRRVKDP